VGQEGGRKTFETSLSNLVRLCLKTTTTNARGLSVVAHTYISSTGEARYLELKSSLSYRARPCLRKPRARNLAQWLSTYLACAKALGFIPSTTK
jgi:hypothetical protein